MQNIFSLFIVLAIALSISSCAQNPCDKTLCINGSYVEVGNTCTCNCSPGTEGENCASYTADYFTGNNLPTTETWKSGAVNTYVSNISMLQNYNSISITISPFIKNSYANSNLNIDLVDHEHMNFNGSQVTIMPNYQSCTFTGAGVKQNNQLIVDGALNESGYPYDFIDSIHIVYQY